MSTNDKVNDIVEHENNAKSQRTRPVVHLTSEKEQNFHDVVKRNYRHFLKDFILVI